SDYNIFVVGRIWEEGRRRPLREAMVGSVPRASRAITTAALALAAGFGMLALGPPAQFRGIATAVGAGILIDAFIVPSLLVAALVALCGGAGQWRGRHYRRATRRPGQTAQPQPADLTADADQEPAAAQPGPAVPRKLGLERHSDAAAGELAGRQRPQRAADDRR